MYGSSKHHLAAIGIAGSGLAVGTWMAVLLALVLALVAGGMFVAKRRRPSH